MITYRVPLRYAGSSEERDRIHLRDVSVCSVLVQSSFPDYTDYSRVDLAGRTHRVRWYKMWDTCIRREWCLNLQGHILWDRSTAFPPF